MIPESVGARAVDGQRRQRRLVKQKVVRTRIRTYSWQVHNTMKFTGTHTRAPKEKEKIAKYLECTCTL